MKNKLFMLLISVFMILTAAGCGKDGEEEDFIQPIVVETIEESEQENDTNHTDNAGEDIGETIDTSGEEAAKGDSTVEKGEAAKTAETQKAEEDDNTAPQTDPEKAVYYTALEKLYKTYTLPDGTELGYNEISDLSENQFAIYDIDQDGREELIVIWTTTYTAGMAGIIYDYDYSSNSFMTELIDFPVQTFYDNGAVEVLLSHNHGLAGNIDDFWPYTFYQYDKGADIYLCAAQVDAWNRAYYELDYDGTLFPEELDADGDGILYRVTAGGYDKLMDLEEYNKWRDSVIGGAKKVEIPFVKMTEESISGKGSAGGK